MLNSTTYYNLSIKPFIVAFICFFLLNLSGFASKYYVAPNGDDSNLGTQPNPFKTIKKALSKAQKPGDIVFVRTGTYVERIYIGQSGSSKLPITLTSFPGEYPVIDGQNKLPDYDWGYLLLIEGDYINVSGFEVKNCNINGTYKGGMGIQVTGQHNKVSNMNVHHIWENGIIVNGDYSIVENCMIWQSSYSNSKKPGSVNWSSGLSAARSIKDGIATGVTLRGNKVYNNWGEGLSSYEAEGTIIQDNIIYDNWSVNLYISDTRGAMVERNIIYNSTDNAVGKRSPFTLGDERSDRPRSANNTIINNLIYNCDLWAFWSSVVAGSGLDNVLIAHNTLVNGQLEIGAHAADKIVNKSAYIENNIFINENGQPWEIKGSLNNLKFSNNLWSKSPPGDLASMGDVIGGPKLSKTGKTGAGELKADYFKLLENSPAIRKGSTINKVNQDFFKNIRDDLPDIGAHELSIEKTSILVYPNPSDGRFNIVTNKKEEGIGRLEIYNINGIRIKSISNEAIAYPYQIDISSQPSGIFTLVLITEKISYSCLIIKCS